MEPSLSVYQQRCSSKTCISSRITAVILSFDQQWYFFRVNMMPPHRMTMVHVSFFVGISSIYQCIAFDVAARLMSIMAIASHGQTSFVLFAW
jgi:hypothetical protein